MPLTFTRTAVPSKGTVERKPTEFDEPLQLSHDATTPDEAAITYVHTFTKDEREDVDKAKNNLAAQIRNAARDLFPDKTARVRFGKVDAKTGACSVTFWVAARNQRRTKTDAE